MSVPGFVRVMAAAPRVHLCCPEKNADEIAALLQTADEAGVSLCVFPQLCLTGSTCGGVFTMEALLEHAHRALERLAALPVKTAFIVGLPVELDGRIYACHAVVCGNKLLGLVPFDPQDAPLRALFAPAKHAPSSCDQYPSAQICPDFTFRCGSFDLCIGSGDALLCAVPAAPAEDTLSHKKRRLLLEAQSAQTDSAVIFAGAGCGESTTDGVYAGDCCIYESGMLLAQNERFARGFSYAIADVDISRLRHHRRTAHTSLSAHSAACETFGAPQACGADTLLRPLSPLPFVPEDAKALRDALMIQTQALLSRMEHTRVQRVVIGVSGGLDSTLALLCAALAFDRAGLSRSGVIGITMPGPGTGKRTRTNAGALMEALGCTAKTIPIGPAVMQHFADIGHSADARDVCYENSQARERTQILMDYANKTGALVLGTGDLSELALGWCTYGGDQMSMYGLNASIPKTLMRPLVRLAASQLGGEVSAICGDILATPVSPELLPGEDGEIAQLTEETLGAYELHDFFLWHMMDSGSAPARLYALAKCAFAGSFDDQQILRALRIFIRRFFSQQFKRSAMPDGPKVSPVSLSPRAGFVMPSDAQAELFIREADSLV